MAPWFSRLCLSLVAGFVGALHAAPTLQAEAAASRRADLAALQSDLESIRRETGVPALGVAVVDERGIAWVAGLGQARQQPPQAADAATMFRVGSVSKLVLSVAVMKLVEQGRLDLNAPLRQLAPEVTFDNPWEARHPVRLVHLLEHTTGWEDAHPSEMAFSAPEGMSLTEALALRPATRKSRWVPGTRTAYSNLGALAAAHVVARVTGMPYERFVQQAVFEPLGMPHSSFFEDERVRRQGAELQAAHRPGLPLSYARMADWPSGALNSSATDMARLLQLLLQRGATEQGAFLAPASVQRMETPVSNLGAAAGVRAGWGLGNESSGFGTSGRAFHGHDGALEGGISRLVYEPALGVGYVLLQSNDDFDAFFRLSRRLHQHLLKGVAAAPALPAQALPKSLQDVSGWYLHITPRRELTRFSEDLMELSHFEPVPGGLRQTFLLGGEQRYLAQGTELLVSPDSGLPTLARVNDPLAGDSLQVGANTFQPVSSLRVFGLLTLGGGGLLLLPLLVLRGVVMAVQRLRGKAGALFGPAVALAGAASMLGATLLAGPLLGGGDSDFGRWTWTSASVWLGGLGFAVLTALTPPLLWRTRGRITTRAGRWGRSALVVASAWLLGLLAYLLSYGVVGMRTWV